MLKTKIMDTLTVSKQKAQEEYRNADAGGKIILSNLFGRHHFFLDMAEWEEYITSRIKTIGDAFIQTGEDPNDPKFNQGTEDDIAFQQLKVIFKAFNPPDWKCDWSDGNHRKWAPWFRYDGTGFRFIGS